MDMFPNSAFRSSLTSNQGDQILSDLHVLWAVRGILGQYVDIYREDPSPEHTMTALSELLTTFLRTKSYIEQLISRHSPGAKCWRSVRQFFSFFPFRSLVSLMEVFSCWQEVCGVKTNTTLVQLLPQTLTPTYPTTDLTGNWAMISGWRKYFLEELNISIPDTSPLL